MSELILNKIEPIKEWLKNISKDINISKVSVLMNDNITGFICSKLSCDVFNNKDVVNIIIPCYSNDNYILTSAKFSNDRNIKYKIISVKDIYDSIMEKDIDEEPIDIIDFLREQIVETISVNNNSMILSLNKIFNDDLNKLEFVFKVSFYDKKTFLKEKSLKVLKSDIKFSIDEIIEISKINNIC